ncbi:reverse transcriptase domain-containing protein [Tanacetum coccineum]
MITTVFAATTPENTPFAYRAYTSINPNPMISLAFVEENYKDYDEEREMEPRPEPNREATPTLRPRSPVVRRQRERVVGFEEAPNREGNRRGRNAEGTRPSEIEAEKRGVNLPPLLVTHLGRNKSGQPLRSSLTSVQGGHQPSTNMRGISLLTAKFSSHFSQQKKFTKIHLSIYNIKQREGESTRAFITRHTDDNLQILGLHEEQHSSGFVHGLRTRSLVEHLSTDLLTTYKGLMEKTYIWIKAREVATNGTPNDQRENFKRSRKSSWDNNRGQKGRDRFSLYRGPNHGLLSNLSKSPREILATEKAARSFEQPPHLFGSRRRKVLVYWENSSGNHDRIPPIIRKETLKFVIVKSDLPYNMLLERTAMQKMEIVVFTIHGAIKFHTTRGIGYHQIQMAKGDEDKMALFAREAVFCYRKMPFGLKNAGATYQRLVDKVFYDQIGRNLEAYVDDMVIKSTSEEEILADIKETFEKFRSINMKSTRRNPKTLKDVQSLNGKIAALGRFLLKGVERSLTFFKVLKSCIDKKNIHWIQEAEATLHEIKTFVEILPTLTAPVQGEILMMYLAASTESISAALFAKREKEQMIA